MKRYWIFFLIASLFLGACGAATPPAQPVVIPTYTSASRTLTVFAAASLTESFTEIGKNFDAAHPGVTTTFNFAGSQALRTQLEQGAIADVFASANTKEMETVISENLVITGTQQIFLHNLLQVILPANNPANIQALEDLSRPGIKLVLAAEDVPVGKYARQALDNLNELYGSGFKDAVMANVVSNEDNVKYVVTKVQLGEADAGIVYVSDAIAAPDLHTIPIPAEYNVLATYPIAVLAQAPNADLGAEFISYVLSAEGRSTLEKWGFTPNQP
jgi:molybdate transport system substrate-binding protein